MVCCETDFLVAILRGDREAAGTLKRLESEDRVLSVAPITIYELMKGARMSARAAANTAKVIDLARRLRPLPIGGEEAELASSICAKLARSGETMGEFDVLIAAASKGSGEALLTRDEAFKQVEGLKTLRW